MKLYIKCEGTIVRQHNPLCFAWWEEEREPVWDVNGGGGIWFNEWMCLAEVLQKIKEYAVPGRQANNVLYKAWRLLRDRHDYNELDVNHCGTVSDMIGNIYYVEVP